MFVAAGLDHAFSTSPVFDEPFFLHSGVTNLTAGATKQATANLVLAQNWMALPIIFRRPQVEPLPEPPGAYSPPLEPATRFLFDPRHDWRWMLRAGRVMILLAGVALAGLVWLWSRELFGPAGAVLSLGLYCLSPTMIANSSLATIDLFTALWFFLACRCWWRLTAKVTPAGVVASGVSSGLLAATKISSVLLGPLVLALLAGRLAAEGALPFPLSRTGSSSPAANRVRRASLALATAAAIAVAVVTLWVCYLPQLTFFRAAEGASVSLGHLARAYAGSLSAVFDFLGKIHLLPELYLHDLRVFLATTAVRRAYMAGEYSLGGWGHFFPVVWFLKAPLPWLLSLGAAAAGIAWGRTFGPLLGVSGVETGAGASAAPSRREYIPLAALIIVYLGASMVSGLNIGIRHILPVFPPLFVLAGAAVLVPARRLWRHAVLGFILLWSARELVTVRGQYLSYLNNFAGGSREGHRWFVDSSYEWGQDLPAFELWLERRGCLEAAGANVLFMDADHATPIAEVEEFLPHLRGVTEGAVAGVRTYQEGECRARRIVGLLCQLLAHLIVFRKAVVDSQCGFKLFTRAAAQRLFALARVNGGMIDVELFALMHRLGIPCRYEPVSWRNQDGSRVSFVVSAFRDPLDMLKIRARDAAGVYRSPVPADRQPWSATPTRPSS
ncbi:MAG: glycosyltransferase family 39 protein [Verrucomicrobiota bacterium]